MLLRRRGAAHDCSRRQIARTLGLLPQDREESLALTALESVLIGRHPHLQFWQREGAQDLAIAQAALERFGLSDCAHAAGHHALGRGAAARGHGRSAGAGSRRSICWMSRAIIWIRITRSRS